MKIAAVWLDDVLLLMQSVPFRVLDVAALSIDHRRVSRQSGNASGRIALSFPGSVDHEDDDASGLWTSSRCAQALSRKHIDAP